MPSKTDRIEARLLPEQLAAIDRAAASEGLSRSAFVVTAAVEKAEQMMAGQVTTKVPGSFFDELLAVIDEPMPAPALTRAAQKARQRGQITSR
jgi:uncharacterized protein (DUF1778 family)